MIFRSMHQNFANYPRGRNKERQGLWNKKVDSILSHTVQFKIDEIGIVVACHVIPPRKNTQSTAVACHRTPKCHTCTAKATREINIQKRSRWLPATRENNTSRKTKSSGKKRTRNVKRETSRTRGLASERKIRRVRCLLVSSSLRCRFLSPPIGGAG